jgi:hypothetical protein
MKKLVALGLSVVSAAALAVAPTAASAEEPPTVGDVCEAIGGIDLGDLIGDADDALADAEAAVTTAETAVDEALADYVAAAVATLLAIENEDDNVADLAADMQEAFDNLVDKVVAWSDAMVAQHEARQNQFSLGLKSDLLEGLSTGLECTAD